ncbi:Na+/H+ antiporter NhaC [Rhizobiaceae bacterium n13]|uniref:Na+/H+ antiporter NhaC n=1 Tax=Ferirhizobium litorale TaxID=2927786 RepID=A0AAE3QIV9_9HYPH|nr:Na+/H+ antiporter NhaC family protein [Fererhizobium litorale]MDI7862771.1 Na+/H+ antiporter NhaC [Fererhizobium litorale]MDI7924365.1 Na+/H+ antiporter NhaC [Fererhizobium litorale]
MTATQPRRPLSLLEAILPIAGLIVLVGLSFFLFGDEGASGPNQVALVFATMIAVAIARRRGYSLEELGEAAVASVGSGIGAIFILLAVGSLIGTWALSGTLIAMVYYGLQLLNPNLFYMTAAAICAIVSFGIGSSWTVAGTIGIGLMGISVNMGLDPAITAAAIISGAYFGDTTSPLSDSANLAAGVANANLYDHVRETLLTSTPALMISLAIFWLFGRAGDLDASDKLEAIESAFHVSPILFLPLAVVVGLALFRLPPFTTIFIGALAGGVLAVALAPDRVAVFGDPEQTLPRWLALIKGVWLALASGYVSTSGHPALDVLATRGGMASMLNTIWLIITAFAFGGVVEKAGMIERLIEPVISKVKSTGGLVTTLVSAIFATNVATADQYLAIVLPGRMFKRAFQSREFAPIVLSRSVGATATPTSALVPWNSCGAYMSATLGVSTFHYFPYAVFSIASPLIAIVVAFLGIRMIRQVKKSAGLAPQD